MVTKAERDKVVRDVFGRMGSNARILGSATKRLDDSVSIPIEFLLERMTADELWNVLSTNKFDADICRRLWQFLDRTNPPTMLHVAAQRVH